LVELQTIDLDASDYSIELMVELPEWGQSALSIGTFKVIDPSPTPTPTSTQTPTPTPTSTPSLTLTPIPSPTPTYSPSPTMTFTPRPTGTPQNTFTSTPQGSPSATQTPSVPTFTPTSTAGVSPTPTPFLPPTFTPTPSMTSPGIDLWLNKDGDNYSSADEFILTLYLLNSTDTSIPADLYIVLDVYNNYWFWPDWSRDPDYLEGSLPPEDRYPVSILEFTWPYYPGTFSGIIIYAAALMPDSDQLIGDIDYVSFGCDGH